VLPVFHHHAVSAVEGRSSILFQYTCAGDSLRATSAFGIEQLPGVLLPVRHLPPSLSSDDRPLFMADTATRLQDLSHQLGATHAVLVPLTRMQEPLGVLAVGTDVRPSMDQLEEVASVGQAFTIALERTRIAAEMDLQLQMRTLLQDFARSASSRTLTAGLETVCVVANRLFGADRTSVWCTIGARAWWRSRPRPTRCPWRGSAGFQHRTRSHRLPSR
jgi:hypothetical protein